MSGWRRLMLHITFTVSRIGSHPLVETPATISKPHFEKAVKAFQQWLLGVSDDVSKPEKH
jgi:hypothetical protein